MAKKKRKASELGGFNIYQDPKKGTVLYDWLTKKGYQLTSSDVGKYSLSQAFLPVAVVLIYVLVVFAKMAWTPSIIIAIVAYIAMRIAYRICFLNKLPYIENYKRPDDGNIFINASKKYNKVRLILLIVLALALIGVTVAYLLTTSLNQLEKVGIIALIIAAVAMLIFASVSLSIQKKNNR